MMAQFFTVELELLSVPELDRLITHLTRVRKSKQPVTAVKLLERTGADVNYGFTHQRRYWECVAESADGKVVGAQQRTKRAAKELAAKMLWTELNTRKVAIPETEVLSLDESLPSQRSQEGADDSVSDPVWFPVWKTMTEIEKVLYLDDELDTYDWERFDKLGWDQSN